MSLINDALKRAKQAHDKQTPPAIRGAPLPTTATGAAPQKSSHLPMVIAGGILLLVMLAIGIYSFLHLATNPRETIIASEPRLSTHIESRAVAEPISNSPTQIDPSKPMAQPIVANPNHNQPDNTDPMPKLEASLTPTVHLASATLTVPVVVMPDPTNPATPDPTVMATPTPSEPAAPPTFPAMRLQGILYQPSRPAAIINGRTLFIGGHVGKVTVIAITRETATVTWNGQTNVLTLPE